MQTRFEQLDKQNPNYSFLLKGLQNGWVRLFEGAHSKAVIMPPTELHLKFACGIQAYLTSQNYDAHLNWTGGY